MRIAPPEASRSARLFGEGVYFTDLVSKAFQYSRPEISNGIGTLVLCEVALGNMQPRLRPDRNASNLPHGDNSTWGVGKLRPNPSESFYDWPSDIEVPLGTT